MARLSFGLALVSFTLLVACGRDSSTGGTGGHGGAGGAPPDMSCVVAKEGTSGVAIQATLLMTSGASPGEVFIDSTGKIACAGATCSAAPGYDTATVIACPSGVLSPGLINAHDHTEFDSAGPIQHGTTRWDHRNGWRKGTGGEMKLSGPPLSMDPAVIAGAEVRGAMGGATSVIGTGGVHGLLRNLAAYPDQTLTEGLTGPTVFFDTFPLGDSNGVELTSGCAYPGPTSSTTAFSKGKAYAAHVAEGVNLAAENEFICVSGSLGLLNAQTAIIHGVGMNAADIQAMAQANAKLIWSPRTNIDLYGNTASVNAFKALGVTIALGTDWLASGSMNMLRELSCADSLNKSYFGNVFSDQELWAMTTKNAAVAARYDSEIGDLQVGLQGDVSLFTGTTADARAIIDAGVEDVRLVLRGGKPIYGDKTLVSAIDPACEDIDVCGTKKQLCMEGTGVTLSQVEIAAVSIYPLFFCKDTPPTNEPSCVPYRDTYPDGITATDKDGDGVPDASDICATIFDPARPMDPSGQADVDADGSGDVCDTSPNG
jgi:Amidohydrolase family